ncbi:MAG: DUF4160 domain-containing protein [Chlamydiae bacterium]|nr:DUF4160 domain-containing protein [Chlamydiota bacterium]MBI3277261.1 DUF4160 domain-containing protein [Chlamydiota bacterium]
MGRIKRGGYIFEFWIGDHFPRHVHVFKNGKFLARVELDVHLTLMEGRITRQIRKILVALMKEEAFG